MTHKEITHNIKLAEERLARHEVALKDMHRIKTLLVQDLVDCIISKKSRYDYASGYINEAMAYLTKTTTNQKTSNDAYKFIKNAISEDFFGRPVKLKEIRYFGLDDCGVEFFVTLGSKQLVLFVPVMKNITVDNFRDAYDGTFSLFEVYDDCWERVCAGYDNEDILRYCKEHYNEDKDMVTT